MKELNTRQRTLAGYLLINSGYVSQKQIKDDLAYADTRTIRSDVRAINCSEFGYLVVSGNDGYAIANHEEAVAFLAKKQKTAMRMLKLASTMRHKLQNNGQLKVNNASNLVEARTVCD